MAIEKINIGDNVANVYTKINNNFEEVASKDAYGTCSTSAATTAKVVTLDATQSARFELVVGQRIAVKFTNQNTATYPTLNVNSTGAKTIRPMDNTTDTSFNMRGESWTAGDTCEFVYDGTYWVWLNSIPYAVKGTATGTNTTTSGTRGAIRMVVDTNNNLYIYTS